MVQFRRILCPTDFSEASLEIIPYAVELARVFGGSLYFVHVVQMLPHSPDDSQYCNFMTAVKADAARRMEALLQLKVPLGVPYTKILIEGRAAEQILQVADQEKIDVIVIATHGLTGWRHLMFGSVTEKVVRTSKIPVLTIRASGDGSGK